MAPQIRRRASRAPLAYLVGLALASLYAFPLGSCTAILLNAGHAADERSPGPGLIPRESLVLLEPRAPVVLHLADSTVVAGRYAGVGLGDPVRYRVAYEAWRSSQADSASWPVVGESVSAHGQGDPPWIRRGGAFVGFTARGVAVAGRRNNEPAAELPFGETGAIGIGGRLHHHYDVHRAVSAGMPTLTLIRVRTKPGGELREVPWGNVDAVTVGRTWSRAATGAIVGLALDALVVVVVVKGLRTGTKSSGCNLGDDWFTSGFASRAPGDFDTATGRFVTAGPSRAFAAESLRGGTTSMADAVPRLSPRRRP